MSAWMDEEMSGRVGPCFVCVCLHITNAHIHFSSISVKLFVYKMWRRGSSEIVQSVTAITPSYKAHLVLFETLFIILI